MADDFNGCRAQHVVLMVGKRLTWCHNNGFSSVNTQWIHILHVANLIGETDSLENTDYGEPKKEVCNIIYALYDPARYYDR